jgi:hypothetical protein
MYPKWGAYQPNFGVSDLTYREGFNNASHPRAAYSMQPSEFHHAGLSGKYSGCLWCLCALIIYIYIIYLFIEREMFFLNVYSFIYFIYSIYIHCICISYIYGGPGCLAQGLPVSRVHDFTTTTPLDMLKKLFGCSKYGLRNLSISILDLLNLNMWKRLATRGNLCTRF